MGIVQVHSQMGYELLKPSSLVSELLVSQVFKTQPIGRNLLIETKCLLSITRSTATIDFAPTGCH
jgi:hypothetical protein